MNTISASEARNRLDQLMDEAAESHIPVTITGERNNVVLISVAHWASIQEALAPRSGQEARDFIARGLASRDDARRTGDYVDAAEVLAELDAMLAKAKPKAAN